MQKRIITAVAGTVGALALIYAGTRADMHRTVPATREIEVLEESTTEAPTETQPDYSNLTREEFFELSGIVQATSEKKATTEENTEPETTTEATTEAPTEAIRIYNIPLSAELQRGIFALSERYEIAYELTLAIIKVESNYVSKVGDGGRSVGLCQIQPKWWQALADERGLDLYDELDNVEVMLIILSAHLDRTGGDLTKALQLYNTGATAGSEYAERIYKNMADLEGGYIR